MFYRKKPVVVEARKFYNNKTSLFDILKFIGLEPTLNAKHAGCRYGTYFINMVTLEGGIKAIPGDYIIKGVAGEFYPCHHEIFEQTYEVCEDTIPKALTENISNPFSRHIRNARVAAGISSRDLSHQLGIDHVSWCRVERGVNGLSSEYWQELCEALPSLTLDKLTALYEVSAEFS